MISSFTSCAISAVASVAINSTVYTVSRVVILVRITRTISADHSVITLTSRADCRITASSAVTKTIDAELA